MTTFQHPDSPFKEDHTASHMAGFTLMNNQVGAVVAQVMAKKPNVKVTYLPSMIRVDAVGRMDFDYDEISEALGEEPGYYDAAPRRSRRSRRPSGPPRRRGSSTAGR